MPYFNINCKRWMLFHKMDKQTHWKVPILHLFPQIAAQMFTYIIWVGIMDYAFSPMIFSRIFALFKTQKQQIKSRTRHTWTEVSLGNWNWKVRVSHFCWNNYYYFSLLIPRRKLLMVEFYSIKAAEGKLKSSGRFLMLAQRHCLVVLRSA